MSILWFLVAWLVGAAGFGIVLGQAIRDSNREP